MTAASPALFDAPIQPRRTRTEGWEIYRAVVLLRRRGHSVYRAGRDDHLVDGERVSTDSLIALAGVRR